MTHIVLEQEGWGWVDEEPWSVGLEPKTYSTTPADVFIAAAVAVFALGVVAVLAIRRALR